MFDQHMPKITIEDFNNVPVEVLMKCVKISNNELKEYLKAKNNEADVERDKYNRFIDDMPDYVLNEIRKQVVNKLRYKYFNLFKKYNSLNVEVQQNSVLSDTSIGEVKNFE